MDQDVKRKTKATSSISKFFLVIAIIHLPSPWDAIVASVGVNQR